MSDASGERILVIKLGALGDFILAQSAFAAIRRHHPSAHIVLLTTKPFMGLAEASPYFDEIWIDEKPTALQVGGILRLRSRLRSGKFTRVYDLQTSDRTSFYYRLLGPGKRPEWSGIASGGSHPDPTPDRAAVHSFDLRVNQLRAAGIPEVPLADLSWMKSPAPIGGKPASQYALLVPGCAPHRPEKRWPTLNFAALATRLAAKGYIPVVIGNKDETPLARIIAAAVPQTVDMTGRTTLFDIADLARDAAMAIGNDTGPMHIIAAVGCPSLTLFSAASRPSHSSPRGKTVSVLQRDDLAALSIEDVESSLPGL